MNEREVAKGFSALWAEFFPMLSPNFIIAFNRAYVHPILGQDGVISPIQCGMQTHHADVLAEFAFRLAAAAHGVGISVKAAAAADSILKQARDQAASRVQDLREIGAPESLELNDLELEEGIRLASVYEQFLRLWPADEEVAFSPHVLGCGVLNSCQADLSIGGTLYEVKTVSRKFQSRDLRQLLVYFGLQAATGEPRWRYGGLLNPRAGLFCQFSIDWLVTRLSGGRPTRMVLMDFIGALSRDAVLDRRF
jgi:hypothetical protein